MKRGRPRKLTEDECVDLRRAYRETRLNVTQVARLFRVSATTASKIIDMPRSMFPSEARPTPARN